MPRRTLLPTSPPMTGNDVRVVQRRLGLTDDGVYGPATGAAVKAWRWRTGFPRAIPGLGPWGQDVLAGKIPLPDDYRARARQRAAAATSALTIPERAVRAMEHWAKLGLVERPARSNVVPQLGTVAKSLRLANWYARMGWPWCSFAAFLAAKTAQGKAASEGFGGRFNVIYVPTVLAEAKSERHGLRVVASPARGDLAIFNWDGGVVDHIGRVRGPRLPNGKVPTVEGNTAPDDGGSQSNGGGMYLRERNPKLIVAYVRDS